MGRSDWTSWLLRLMFYFACLVPGGLADWFECMIRFCDMPWLTVSMVKRLFLVACVVFPVWPANDRCCWV